MYTLDTLRNTLTEDGIESFITSLANGSHTKETIEQLTDLNILCNGYPNLSLIYTLV
jgi:hypothetical protein